MIRRKQVGEGPKNFAVSDRNGASALTRSLLSKQELALKVGVSVRTLDNWVAQKRIPFLRLSARMLKFNLDRVLVALGRFEVQEVGVKK